jgi:hypothetical protein
MGALGRQDEELIVNWGDTAIDDSAKAIHRRRRAILVEERFVGQLEIDAVGALGEACFSEAAFGPTIDHA